jgi:phosphorylase/glycogen(starch) synthase
VLIGPDLRKHNHNGKEFLEDTNLFAEWKSSLAESNLNVSIGRWDIPCKPIVILIDFTFGIMLLVIDCLRHF